MKHDAERARWVVRGQQRTRETYGLPHPWDFPGDTPELAAARWARWEAWAAEWQGGEGDTP